jgi:hypothetical protein
MILKVLLQGIIIEAAEIIVMTLVSVRRDIVMVTMVADMVNLLALSIHPLIHLFTLLKISCNINAITVLALIIMMKFRSSMIDTELSIYRDKLRYSLHSIGMNVGLERNIIHNNHTSKNKKIDCRHILLHTNLLRNL